LTLAIQGTTLEKLFFVQIGSSPVVNDVFHEEIIDFAKNQRGIVIGPPRLAEISKAITPFTNLADTKGVSALVFQKGILDEVPPLVWSAFFGRVEQSFANAVFVAFTVNDNTKTHFGAFFEEQIKPYVEAGSSKVRSNPRSFVKRYLSIRKSRRVANKQGQESSEVRAIVQGLLRKIDIDNHPNINDLWAITKDIDFLKLNIKNMGYELARQMQSAMPKLEGVTARPLGLSSRPSRQSDIESDWLPYWCAELKIPVTYHRKIWEFAFLLQSLFDADLLKQGGRALGFGCGEEPIASYLAARGLDVTVTDLDPERVAGLGWIETGQHTDSLEKVWYPDIVNRSTFDEKVSLRYVDMTDIPSDINGYDFCWSICALEHLGSIRKGLDFIKNSLSTVRVGGYSIHTTEYNFLSKDETIDNWPTVLFLRKHFELLAQELIALGHEVAPLDFNVGDGVLDKFVDIPPYAYGEGGLDREIWSTVGQAAHLKLSVDGFACTCFGLVVRKGPKP